MDGGWGGDVAAVGFDVYARVSGESSGRDVATFGYTCQGGKFVTSWYWRQQLPRFTRHLTVNLRQRGSDHLASCSATEEFGDGSERSASESLIWDMEGSDVTVMLTCDYLRPNQAVTLRWEKPRAVA